MEGLVHGHAASGQMLHWRAVPRLPGHRPLTPGRPRQGRPAPRQPMQQNQAMGEQPLPSVAAQEQAVGMPMPTVREQTVEEIPAPRPAKKPIWRKVLSIAGNILFYLLILAMLAAALLYAFNQNPNKSVFGYRFYEALTSSMSPEIGQGDLILVQMAGAQQAKVGDIITCAVDETGTITITHRLVETYTDPVQGEMLVTQGDTNPDPDNPVPAGQMIGIVSGTVPYVGLVVGTLKTAPLLVLAPIALLITLLSVGRYLFKRRRQKQELTKQKGEKE